MTAPIVRVGDREKRREGGEWSRHVGPDQCTEAENDMRQGPELPVAKGAEREPGAETHHRKKETHLRPLQAPVVQRQIARSQDDTTEGDGLRSVRHHEGYPADQDKVRDEKGRSRGLDDQARLRRWKG